MPCKVGFNERGPHARKGVQHRLMATSRIFYEGVFDEMLGVARNPRNPSVNRDMAIGDKGRIPKCARRRICHDAG